MTYRCDIFIEHLIGLRHDGVIDAGLSTLGYHGMRFLRHPENPDLALPESSDFSVIDVFAHIHEETGSMRMQSENIYRIFFHIILC